MKYQQTIDPLTNAVSTKFVLAVDNNGNVLMSIPNQPKNKEWQDYQKWLKAGNTVLPPAQGK